VSASFRNYRTGDCLKHLFAQYKGFILHLLAPLSGPWAIFFLTAVDAAAIGIPMDALLAYYAYTNRARIVPCILMGALGSTLGSLVPYLLGYKGGEALVAKRVGRQRFDRAHARVERYGMWALIIPSMLPPPTPFKLFVFCAGVAEMSWPRFCLSIFSGRLARFTLLSVLTIIFGPQIVDLFQTLFVRHWPVALAVVAAAILSIIIVVRRRRLRADEPVKIA
jgi:membrane protein YqaA with SNARE-associated domain